MYIKKKKKAFNLWFKYRDTQKVFIFTWRTFLPFAYTADIYRLSLII